MRSSAGVWLAGLLAMVATVFGLLTSLAAEDQKRMTAYDHHFTSIDGKPMPLEAYRGKVLAVVNTASFCGFTDQYQGLQKLHETFEAKGVVVIGVPSGDFGGQEYGTDQETKAFCEGAFGITFPLTTKSHVRGDAAHPFYAWAASVLGAGQAPAWNFHKYIVARDGTLVSAFGTRTKPNDPAFIKALEHEVAKTSQRSVRSPNE
jgi:glutathione peroxidase